jgi:hypothetical protein
LFGDFDGAAAPRAGGEDDAALRAMEDENDGVLGTLEGQVSALKSVRWSCAAMGGTQVEEWRGSV